MGGTTSVIQKDKLKTPHTSLFDISATDIKGKERLLGDICKDKKCVMVVNVAGK
jgi:hypothetical protein